MQVNDDMGECASSLSSLPSFLLDWRRAGLARDREAELNFEGLLRSNVRKSLRIIALERPQVPDEFLPSRGEAISLLLTRLWEQNAAQPLPRFYSAADGRLSSLQEEFFGLYALRNVVRGALVASSWIGAAGRLTKPGCYAASILCSYTAMFHLLIGYLAVHGTVLIPQVLAPSVVPLVDAPEAVMARLTRKNTWVFERRGRSHRMVWSELGQVLAHQYEADEIPEFIDVFLQYVVSYGPTDLVTADEDWREAALRRSAYIRHEAVYESYGFDDWAYDEFTNEDYPGAGYGIDARVRIYREFAVALLRVLADWWLEVDGWIEEEVLQETRALRFLSVVTPPFEMVKPEFLEIEGEDDLTASLQTSVRRLVQR